MPSLVLSNVALAIIKQKTNFPFGNGAKAKQEEKRKRKLEAGASAEDVKADEPVKETSKEPLFT